MDTSNEHTVIESLRKRIEADPGKAVSETQPVSRDEALTEAEYIFKNALMSQQPQSMEQAGAIIQGAFQAVYTYLKQVGVHVTPDELQARLTREVKLNG